MLKIAKYFLLLFSFSTLTGCAAIGSFFSNISANKYTKFAQELPDPVSVAWRDARGDVWIVPKRGVFITSVQGGTSWGPNGSYVVVRGNPSRISIHANNQWWSLKVPGWNE